MHRQHFRLLEQVSRKTYRTLWMEKTCIQGSDVGWIKKIEFFVFGLEILWLTAVISKQQQRCCNMGTAAESTISGFALFGHTGIAKDPPYAWLEKPKPVFESRRK